MKWHLTKDEDEELQEIFMGEKGTAVSASNSTELLSCPCGKTPNELIIADAGQGGKWADAVGDCCGVWEIEFRTQYKPLDSDECMALAIEAWNEAPRAG